MRKTTSAILALCALAAVTGRADDPEPLAGEKAELAKLEGTWVVTKAIWGKREARSTPATTYSFDADRLVVVVPPPRGEGKQTFKVKLDTKKTPYRYTLTPDGGGKAQSGVYKFEKGLLYLARRRGGDATDFEGNGRNVEVLVMKKEKPKEKKAKE